MYFIFNWLDRECFGFIVLNFVLCITLADLVYLIRWSWFNGCGLGFMWLLIMVCLFCDLMCYGLRFLGCLW